MRQPFYYAIAIFMLSTFGAQQRALAQDISPDPNSLVGTWDVSLFFSKTAPPSVTTMVITETADGKLVGSFYGTAFKVGRVTTTEGEIVFSVVTEDGSGPYATSGRLRSDDVIYGQTLSVGRDFLMAWEARRKSVDD